MSEILDNFSMDYGFIDKKYIVNIQKYLMKKHDIELYLGLFN